MRWQRTGPIGLGVCCRCQAEERPQIDKLAVRGGHTHEVEESWGCGMGVWFFIIFRLLRATQLTFSRLCSPSSSDYPVFNQSPALKGFTFHTIVGSTNACNAPSTRLVVNHVSTHLRARGCSRCSGCPPTGATSAIGAELVQEFNGSVGSRSTRRRGRGLSGNA